MSAVSVVAAGPEEEGRANALAMAYKVSAAETAAGESGETGTASRATPEASGVAGREWVRGEEVVHRTGPARIMGETGKNMASGCSWVWVWMVDGRDENDANVHARHRAIYTARHRKMADLGDHVTVRLHRDCHASAGVNAGA
jgi:hypothetical protein